MTDTHSSSSPPEYQELVSGEEDVSEHVSSDNGNLEAALSYPERTSRDQEQEESSFSASSSSFSLQQIFFQVQRYAAITAHALAVAQVLVVYWWISKFLGGLSSLRNQGHAKQVFNWHPLLMVTAFAFMTVSSSIFRYYKHFCTRDRNIHKIIHGSCWLVAAFSATVGLLAVLRSHNDGASGYIANMYSLHSWIGATVIVLYVVQFLVGLGTFGGPYLACARWSNLFWKRLVLQFHLKLGPLIYFLTGATILLGIQEKEGFVGCAYHVDSPDLFPPQHVHKIPSSCLVSHLLGILVFLTTVCMAIALADIRQFA